MTWLEFENLLAAAKRKNPIWFTLDSDPPASDSEIVNAEALLQTRFSPQYRDFLKEYGGGLFAFVNIFSVRPNSEWNVVYRNKQIGRNDFIAISDNGVGDQFGFRTVHGICQPEIFFLDHEESNKVVASRYADLFEYVAKVGLKT